MPRYNESSASTSEGASLCFWEDIAGQMLQHPSDLQNQSHINHGQGPSISTNVLQPSVSKDKMPPPNQISKRKHMPPQRGQLAQNNNYILPLIPVFLHTLLPYRIIMSAIHNPKILNHWLNLNSNNHLCNFCPVWAALTESCYIISHWYNLAHLFF